KRVLPITFTPHLGRGEKAMKTLIWTLQALQSNIIGQLSLYQNEIIFDNHGKFTENEHFQILKESLEIFQAS
ncbi:MAG: hypothetical protein MRY83_23915, partial [Flavobacteriales bacterium]|nr:hypothetical protein [Flavobacteriales bacterium]